ncbi:YKT6 [Enterospora canceri]|uniref:YKT6 n=1 Tax=Enterospora canceri TaxID=1081671 RepID=A0A1Y1S7J3_9MICR|nr:YKT6 [Enterospora canceri]
MPIYAAFSVNIDSFKITKEAFMLEKYGFFTRIAIRNLLRGLASDFTRNIKHSASEGYLEIEEKLEDEKIVIATVKEGGRRVIVVTDGAYNGSVRFKAVQEARKVACNYDKLVDSYRDWRTKDLGMQIEREMKQANENVVKGLEAVLERGQTLNDLVEKSESLSKQTKMLYKTAKKQNRCC